MEEDSPPELQDWELLLNSESLGRGLDAVETADGIIRFNYFSLENEGRCLETNFPDDVLDESDKPSWIDPDSMTQGCRRNPSEMWSNSTSDHSEDPKSVDCSRSHESMFPDTGRNMEFGVDGEAQAGDLNTGNAADPTLDMSSEMDNNSLPCCDIREANVSVINEGETGITGVENKQSDGILGQGKAWWKIPLEALKCCVLRIGPLWSLSMAVAVMGLMLLGQRLYKMKSKSANLQFRIPLDDKSIRHFVGYAARLGEALPSMRRIPVLHHLLPSVGIESWLSL